jgi:hypothetical protein
MNTFGFPFFLFLFLFCSGVVKSIDTFSGLLCTIFAHLKSFYLIILSALPCKVNVMFNLHLCSLIQMFECIFSSNFYLSVCILYTNSNIGAHIVPLMNGASNF